MDYKWKSGNIIWVDSIDDVIRIQPELLCTSIDGINYYVFDNELGICTQTKTI